MAPQQRTIEPNGLDARLAKRIRYLGITQYPPWLVAARPTDGPYAITVGQPRKNFRRGTAITAKIPAELAVKILQCPPQPPATGATIRPHLPFHHPGYRSATTPRLLRPWPMPDYPRDASLPEPVNGDLAQDRFPFLPSQSSALTVRA